ncbi:spore germination protein [Fictibacillus macauensis ZFHKF-1]|uniref:Spore germination protein n=1 Tax=Fictibacillus macauensis ZFHKF-1 TaxID=1196324 RepID=I8J5M4_9BACL|nr:Ger(x)C family spore germination protein [Fictibacillus macauensis]EIT87101.1 spore germination protein [Fictibacillus macauensis ZFHKF-1]
MIIHKKILVLFLSGLLPLCMLTGCWDQRLIKESRLILVAGLDVLPNNKIEDTVIYPVVNKTSGSSGEVKSVMASSYGVTTRDARFRLDKKVSQNFDPSKNRVFLFGEKLARQDMYASLDVIYRDPKGAVNAMVAVVKGTAKDALSIKSEDSPLLSVYYPQLLRSSSEIGLFKITTVQSICASMFDPGIDFVMPYIKPNMKTKDRTNVIGTALFHKTKMTGTLNEKESLMLMLLNKEKAHYSRFTFKITNKQKVKEEDYVTITVNKLKRDWSIKIDKNNHITVPITLSINAAVNELPSDHLNSHQRAIKIEKKVSKEMTQLAKKTLSNLQQANADILGVGKHIRAFQNDKWIKLNWDKDYKKITFEPKVKVTITQHGIIN